VAITILLLGREGEQPSRSMPMNRRHNQERCALTVSSLAREGGSGGVPRRTPTTAVTYGSDLGFELRCRAERAPRLYSSDALERGYERLVGKDEVLPYREGPMLSWLKVKVPHYREDERGWEPQKT
jgi:hypothetical protein